MTVRVVFLARRIVILQSWALQISPEIVTVLSGFGQEVRIDRIVVDAHRISSLFSLRPRSFLRRLFRFYPHSPGTVRNTDKQIARLTIERSGIDTWAYLNGYPPTVVKNSKAGRLIAEVTPGLPTAFELRFLGSSAAHIDIGNPRPPVIRIMRPLSRRVDTSWPFSAVSRINSSVGPARISVG